MNFDNNSFNSNSGSSQPSQGQPTFSFTPNTPSPKQTQPQSKTQAPNKPSFSFPGQESNPSGPSKGNQPNQPSFTQSSFTQPSFTQQSFTPSSSKQGSSKPGNSKPGSPQYNKTPSGQTQPSYRRSNQGNQPPIKGFVVLGAIGAVVIGVACLFLFDSGSSRYASIQQPDPQIAAREKENAARRAENERRHAINKQRTDEARRDLANFRAANVPKTPQAQAIERAIDLENANKHKEAIAAFEEAWKIDPTDAYPANQIAIIYRTKLNNPRASLEWEKKVSQISKKTLDTVAEKYSDRTDRENGRKPTKTETP